MVGPFSIIYNPSTFGKGTKERIPWALEWAFTTGSDKLFKAL